MSGSSWRWTLLAAAAWTGASLARLPVAPDAAVACLAALASLAWAAARRRRGLPGAVPAAGAVLFAVASLASAPPSAGESPPPRLTAAIADVEPRPGSIRLRIDSTSDPARWLDVRLTGDPGLDAPARDLVPGAIVEGPVERAEDARFARAAAPAVFDVDAGGGGLGMRTGAVARAAFRARAVERLAASRHEPEGRSGIVIALLTGLRGFVPHDLTAAIRRSGLAHLFVVSGMHVGWIVVGLGLLARRAGGRESRAAGAAEVAAVACAAVLLPLSPPVRRAASAVAIARVANVAGRRTPADAALAVAVALALVSAPVLASSWSFALTVSASAALVAAGRLPRGPVRVLALLAAPAAATWPLVVTMTGRIAPWGAPATLPALPPTAAALGLGWLAVALPGGTRAAEEAARAAVAAAGILERMVVAVGSWPLSGRLAAPCGPAWATIALGALAAALCAPSRRARRVAACLALAAAAWPLRPLPADGPAGEARVLDVGQGQAVLLRAGGAAILVDTGDDRSRAGTASVLARLRALRVGRLDALVLSHADRDHAGGAREVLAALRPALLVLPGPSSPDRPETAAIVRAAARAGIPSRPMFAGESLAVGAIRLDAWHPRTHEPLRGNEASLVLRVTLPGISLVLPGDAGHAAERVYLRRSDGEPVPVLVAGHHGSRTATGTALLERLGPRSLLVSCGNRERFGHPHPDTLARARRAGARPLVTARGGEIVVRGVRGRPVATQPR